MNPHVHNLEVISIKIYTTTDGGDVDATIVVDVRNGLQGTTWDRLAMKCFAACKETVASHFGDENKDVN